MSNAVLPGTQQKSHLNDAELRDIMGELGSDRLCPNCNLLMAGEATFCQGCGYYRSLGTFVTTMAEKSSSAASEAGYTRDWIRCVIGSSSLMLIVIGCSVGARFVTAPYTAERFWYSVVQIAVGVLMFLSAHVAAWIYGLLHTDDVKALDVILNPIDVWRATLEQLPKSWRRVSIGGSGLLAVILGVTVVEGVTLAHITGKRVPPEKPQVLKALVGQATKAGKAQAGDKAQTLEEAIEEFAKQGEDLTSDLDEEAAENAYNPWGKEKNEDESATEEVSDAESAQPEVAVKCVIVGYTNSEEGEIGELLVAAMHRGRLTWAATVSDGVSEHLPIGLSAELAGLTQSRPSITCPVGERKVFWVRPKATCQINCHGVRTNGQLVGPVLSKPQLPLAGLN